MQIPPPPPNKQSKKTTHKKTQKLSYNLSDNCLLCSAD